MGFKSRSAAKPYEPKDGDTLGSIAEAEAAAGNPVSADDIARFNWGTADPDVIDELLRDEMGCYKRGEDKRFIFSADVEPRGEILIPLLYKKEGLSLQTTHKLHVRSVPPPPKQFEGCARIEGVRFEFDKSFVRPSVVGDLEKVQAALEKKPDAKLIIFGHTDKVGSPSYNKKLSERRARSVYAFITNRPGIWEELYNEEQWGIRAVQEILKDMGGPYDPGPVDGINGQKTKDAVKAFQGDNGLAVDGVAGKATREKLFTAYMGGKHDIEIDEGRFMDPPTVGCSEFNPVVETEKPCEKNRRVTFYLFNEARLPNLPCAEGDIAPCQRQTKEPLPRYRDSFHCSFYDSIARHCPGEGGDIPPVLEPALAFMPGDPGDKKFAQDADDAAARWRVDHHFVPGVETLDIDYRIQGLAARTVSLRIHSERTGEEVYHYELTAGEKADGEGKRLAWDGMTTIASGDLKDRHINPLFGPYTLRLVSDDGTESALARFHVLYHGLKLRAGTWTPDGAPPPEGERVKWVQYTLNDLGYFAGPVNGTKDAQTSRAIRRYKYDAPGMVENDDENEAAFLEKLKKGERKRQVLTEPAFLTDPAKTSSAIVDHHYFYFGTDGASGLGNWLTLTGHRDEDADKLDRFEMPVEAVVYLVSKTDPDGSAAEGKCSPEGTGTVEVEWKILDPPADLTPLPTPTTDVPSHGRAYVKSVLDATAGNAGDAEDAQDNCPTAQGGHRTDNAGWFRVGAGLVPFTGTADGARVFARAYHHLSDHTKKNGAAGILFRGTYIAGDDFVITARIVFEHEPNKDVLESTHKDFTGKELKDLYLAKSGKLLTERRHRVAAMVDWPTPPYSVSMAEVAAAYATAHCRLDTAHDTLVIEKVFASDADRKEYLDLCVAEHAGWKASDVSFDTQGMYPRKLPEQGGSESPRDYKRRIDALVNDFLKPSALAYPASYDFFMKFANLLQGKAHRTQPAGSLILRANFCRPVKVKDHSGIPIIGPIIDLFLPTTEHIPQILCVGLCAGVTIISNPMGKDEQERFLFAHEVGHNRYLMHHHTKGDGTSDRPSDHDTADLNCTMCYPFGIQARPGLTWNRGDTTRSEFCGKCILKLRGWLVHTGLPASH